MNLNLKRNMKGYYLHYRKKDTSVSYSNVLKVIIYYMKRIFFLSIFSSVIFFCSCADNQNKDIDGSMIVGTWKLRSVDTAMSSNTYIASLLKPVIYHYMNDEIEFGSTFEFSEDGTYANNLSGYYLSGTYSVDGNELMLNDGAEGLNLKMTSLTQNTLKIEVDLAQEIRDFAELPIDEAKVILIFICTTKDRQVQDLAYKKKNRFF